jgi:hypothetical protein
LIGCSPYSTSGAPPARRPCMRLAISPARVTS